MVTTLLTSLKKFTAEVLVASLVLLALQPNFVKADGSLAISYDLPANSGITASQISYTLETNSGAVVRASNTQSVTGIPAGSYQLRVTSLPSGYTVTNSPHPIPVNINNNEISSISVMIRDQSSSGLSGVGTLSTNFTFPTNTQFGAPDVHLVLETSTGKAYAQGSSGNINNIVTGFYYVRVDKVPAGHAVANTLHPIPITISGGQITSLTISILPQNQVPARTVGDLSVNYIFSPEGVKPEVSGFHFVVENPDGGIIAAGNQGTLYHLPVGNFKLKMDLMPKDYKVESSPYPIPVSIIAGAKVAVTINMKDTAVKVTETPKPPTTTTPAPAKTEPKTEPKADTPTTDESDPEASASNEQACEYADTPSLSVKYLCQLGIIDAPTLSANFGGDSKEYQFNGDYTLTRAEFTKMMILITYDEEEIEDLSGVDIENGIKPFPDVDTNAWFSSFVIVAKNEDHVQGYPDGKFVAWNPIRMSEALKILFNTARHDNAKVRQDLETTLDTIGPDNDWYIPYAVLAQTYGGFTPELNQPHGEIYSQRVTRQQAADIIYTIIQNAGIEPSTQSRLSNLKGKLSLLQGTAQL